MSTTPVSALRCPKCLADAGTYIGETSGHPAGTYRCGACAHVWSVMDDPQIMLPAYCRHCRATLTIHMDRWNPDVRHRQHFTCPACIKRDEGTFSGRIVRVTRRWDTAEAKI